MRRFSSILIAFTLLMTTWAWTTEHHVSPSGKDSNPGTRSQPWRTIQHAADSVAPGDIVYIHTGTYTEDVIFNISGTAGAYITFSAAPGEKVTAKGLEFARSTAYLKLSKLTVQGFSVWGVFLRGSNHHISLSGLTIIGGEAGVRITWGYSGQPPEDGPVSDVILKNSFIQGSIYTAVDCTPGPCDRSIFRNLEITGAGGGQESWGADGLAVERGKDILVEDCYIHDNGGDGIDLNSRDFKGNVSGVVVRRNIVVRNHRTGIKLWAGGRIENNILWGQGHTPVSIGAYPSTYEVVNNTIAYNMWDEDFSVRNYAFVAAYPDGGTSSKVDLTLLNNIFAFNSGDALGGPTGLYLGEGVNLVSEGHNLFWSREDGEIQAEFVKGDPWFSRTEIADGTWAAATGQGTGETTADPLFVAGWQNVNLHLKANSPAIDAGTSENAPSVDCEGRQRPAGHGYDIGAYEYGASPKGPEIELNKTSLRFTGEEGKDNPAPNYFKVRNSGSKKLTYKTRSNKKWIKLKPKKGSSKGERDKIEVTVDISSLKAGKYRGTIKVKSKKACNSPQKVGVNLTIKKPEQLFLKRSKKSLLASSLYP